MILMRWVSDRPLLARLLVLQGLALFIGAFITQPYVSGRHNLDLRTYYDAVLKLRQGQIPYVDFPLEYPPFALAAFVVPHFATVERPPSYESYIWLFFMQSLVLSTLIMLIIAYVAARWLSRRSLPAVLLSYALLVGIGAPLFPWRYDLFPALLTALALLAVLERRPAPAGVALGLGVAAKLYPAMLGPILLAYYLAGKDGRAALRLIAGGSAGLGAVFVPFALQRPEILFSFLSYHMLRGIQAETLPAGILMLGHVLGLTSLRIEFNFGALHLITPLADAILTWLPLVPVVLAIVLLASCYGRFREEQRARGLPEVDSLIAYCFIVLLAFILTNKVFSPQYLVWLLPVAPLLRRRYLAPLAVAFALTIYLYPFTYDDLIGLKAPHVVILNVRNLLLLGLMVWLLVDYAPQPVARRLARWWRGLWPPPSPSPTGRTP